jgi:hypothetical protein
MKKQQAIAKATKIKVYKEGTKKSLFSLRLIIFDPAKHFVSTDEAKDHWRKKDHMSKQKMKDEFISIFAIGIPVGRGKKKHWEFNKVPKTEADAIFIVPKKYRKEAAKAIENLEFFVMS